MSLVRKRSVNQLADLDVSVTADTKTPKSESSAVVRYSFGVLYLLIKNKNKAAIEALLSPAANHNQIILQDMLRQFPGMDQHFPGMASMNQYFPLIYVKQIFISQNQHQDVAWLTDNFLLPVNAIHIPAKSVNLHVHIIKLALLQRYDELLVLIKQSTDQQPFADLIMIGILYSGVIVVHENAWRELLSLFSHCPGFADLMTNIASLIHPVVADKLLPKSSVVKSISVLVNKKYQEFHARSNLPESSGLCQGLSVINSQSFLCYEETKLTSRINYFFRNPVNQIEQQIASAKQRISSRNALAGDLDLLETEIYMQNVSLAQKPAQLQGFFANNKLPHLTQNKLNVILPLIESNKMSGMGGLCVAGQSAGVYLQDELLTSLMHVSQFFVNHYPQFTGRFSLLMSSVDHTLSVIYDAARRTFTLVNGAHLLASPVESCHKLVSQIKKAFVANDCLILYTDVLCSGNDAKLIREAFLRLSAMSPFAEIHSYSPERASCLDARGASWLCVVTAHENEKFVNYLLNSGANPNLPGCSYSPLSMAMQLGNEPIIARLKQASALSLTPDATAKVSSPAYHQ